MNSPDAVDVADNLAQVEVSIADACERGGRQRSDVTLIAVSKSQPLERIEAALEAGQRIFGENYVQESAGRWPELRQRFTGCNVHLIGPLQSNKSRQAVELFDCIQSLDRMKLAVSLRREIDRVGKAPILFCQVNTGEEPQKAGILPQDADAFIERCQRELELNIEGVMAIPPASDDIALHCQLLEKIADRNGIGNISIGMSSDFEAAVEFGATHVRVGSAIFGARPAKPLPRG